MPKPLILMYESTATSFDSNGVGALPSAIEAKVTEERNGAYDVTIKYPRNGIHVEQISNRRIIMCKPNPYDNPEPFRIYDIKKSLSDNNIIVSAHHISYDLSGIGVSPFTASSANDALQGLKNHAVNPCNFSFNTNITTSGAFSVEKPNSLKSRLGGNDGSVLDVYGGEYKFSRFNVSLLSQRGSDNVTTISYGKNLTGLVQKENDTVYTSVYPYYYSDATGTIELTEKIVNAPGTYHYSKTLPLDLSDKFTEKPTEAELREEANKYISSNNIGVPHVSMDVKFIDLADTDLKRQLSAIRLCDTLTIKFTEFNVNAVAKVNKAVYDVLSNRYDEISIGDTSYSLSDTIINTKKAAEEKPSDNFLQTAVDNATKLLSGVLGGHLILWNSQTKLPGNPNELLISQYAPDDLDHNYLTSGHVWRFNLGGWGHSSNGYNGSYSMAATLDGGFVADFITTGVIRALSIIAPRIASDETINPKFSLNGSTGEIKGSTIISPEIKNSETNASLLINNTGFYTSGSLKNGTFSRTEIKSGIINIYNNLTQFTNSDDGGKKSVYIGSGTNTSGDKSAGIIQLLNGGSLWIYDLQNEKYALIEGTNISIDRVNGHAPVLASDVSLSHQYMLQWDGTKLNFIVDNMVVKSI